MKNVELAEKLAKEHPGKKYWFTGETANPLNLEPILDESVRNLEYEMVEGEHVTSSNPALNQIISLYDIVSPVTGQTIIEKGTLGGYIENEDSLSQDGSCFVCEGAYVFANGKVSENAIIGSISLSSGNLPEGLLLTDVFPEIVCFGAHVRGNARVNDSIVRDEVIISGCARILSSNIVGYYSADDGISEITDNACVIDAETYGAVKIKDDAQVYNASLAGYTVIDGCARVGISKDISEVSLQQLGFEPLRETTWVLGGHVHIGGHAIVDSSMIEEDVEIIDYARVFDHAWLSGNAVIDGQAKVSEGISIQGDAHIGGCANIADGTYYTGEILE